MKKTKIFIVLCYQTFVSLLKILKNKSTIYYLYEPINNSKDIIVLGNGPSLKDPLKNHLDFLKSKDIFAVNKFCLSDEFNILQPKYCILLDPAFFIKNKAATKFLILQEEIIDAFLKKVTWDLTLFIPISTDMQDQWSNISSNNKHVNIQYINTNSASGFRKMTHFLFKHNLSMPFTQNVLIGAIFLSLNLGYKKIYLLGAEHSWTEDLRVNQNNQLYIRDKHFYGEVETLFYKGIDKQEIWKMHEILSAWSKTFMSYFILANYANHLHADIFNLTPNSYIDAFPRKNINEITGIKHENNF